MVAVSMVVPRNRWLRAGSRRPQILARLLQCSSEAIQLAGGVTMFKRVVAGLMVVGMAGAVGCAADAQEEESFTTAALEQGLDCHTNNGIHPMKAALAVAMATEIGRLDPVNDLFVANDFVKLSDQARALCSSRGFESCPNTEAILGMQNALVNQEVDQSVFNATSLRHDLVASFDRQRNHERNLEMNDPSRVPGPHELWALGTSDYGACGIHYDFQASGERIDNIVERMEFFGGHNNPFIDYRSTSDTVSIDPTPTMNGGGSSGSNACTYGCMVYGTALRGKCCACNGRYGIFSLASWDRTMLYCAY